MSWYQRQILGNLSICVWILPLGETYFFPILAPKTHLQWSRGMKRDWPSQGGETVGQSSGWLDLQGLAGRQAAASAHTRLLFVRETFIKNIASLSPPFSF